MMINKGPLHNYVSPKMAVFDPPTHPVTLSHVSPDPPTHPPQRDVIIVHAFWEGIFKEISKR